MRVFRLLLALLFVLVLLVLCGARWCWRRTVEHRRWGLHRVRVRERYGTAGAAVLGIVGRQSYGGLTEGKQTSQKRLRDVQRGVRAVECCEPIVVALLHVTTRDLMSLTRPYPFLSALALRTNPEEII